MDITFMNSEISKTSDPQTLSFNLSDKVYLKISDKYAALLNLHTKRSYKNNRFKISAPTRNEEFELPDGLYSVSDIQDYF